MTGIFVPQRTRQATVLPSPRSQLRLRIRFESGKKRIISVPAAKCTIGSHEHCAIRLPVRIQPIVHCLLLRSRGQVVARGWSDECTINGRPFEIATLAQGDTLRIAGATICLHAGKKQAKRSKKSSANPVAFGKKLVRTIGVRLAHLEQRLAEKQRRLAKQIEKRSMSAAQPPSAQVLEPAHLVQQPPVASPALVEGLTTLRSAVEELRSQVEEVAVRPWPVLPSPPAIDPEALIGSASTKMSDLVQASLRESRIQDAHKFEQIGREFDRIGTRLVDFEQKLVEQKLSLPTSETLAEQVRPVCEAVDFVRSGLQAIENRQTIDAQRFDELSNGLASLSQSTMNRLDDLAEKLALPPDLSLIETKLTGVSDRVAELAREWAEGQRQFLTREDVGSLVKQLDAAAVLQPQFEERFLAIDGRFSEIAGQWAHMQAGAESQFRALVDRFDALAAQSQQTHAEPVDLSPIEQLIGESRLELADHGRAIAGWSEAQQALVSRVDSNAQKIESLQSQIANQAEWAQEFAQRATEGAADRSRIDSTLEQGRAAQESLLQQMLALEDRCIYLESELARLSHLAMSSRGATNESASSLAIQCDEGEPATTGASDSAPYAGNYYSTASGETVSDEVVAPEESYAVDTAPSEFLSVSSPPTPSTFTAPLSLASFESDSTTSAPAAAGEVAASSEEAQVVPNSLVESLRRSGIWKEGQTGPEQDDSSTAEDARDIVGTTFPEPASPIADDPSPRSAESLSKSAWSMPHPSPSDHEEESIDAYMERLMQRVSGGTGEVTGAMAVAEHLQRAKAQSAKKAKASAAPANDGEFEYTPKVAAPEKNSDLSALRELAMTSANVNIQNYHAANKAKTANEKWVVVMVAMICAMGLCYLCLNYKSEWSYLAAGAAFMVALYWAIQASMSTVAAKRLHRRDQDDAPSRDKTASKIDVNLLQNVQKPDETREQPSAGEAFKALIAERERSGEQDTEANMGAG